MTTTHVEWSTVCIVQVTRDMPHSRTAALISVLMRLGASYVKRSRVSCVCTARNLALTEALDKHASKKTMLLIDDDIVAGVEQAQEIVARCQSTGIPQSARYIQDDGRLALTRVSKDRWHTGLGFISIPTELLIKVAPPKVRIEVARDISDSNSPTEVWIHPLCTAGVEDDGEYRTDDHSLCRRLGGVSVPDVNVLHNKPVGLAPPRRLHPDDD